MPAQFALISVPDPVRAVRLASVLQSAGYDIITDAATDLSSFRAKGIHCARSGRDLPEIHIGSLAAVVAGLPDLRGGTIEPDAISYDRCALLVRAASSARQILVIAQESDYERAIREILSPEAPVISPAAPIVSPEKARLELCCWSLQIASTWLNHASRFRRKQIFELQSQTTIATPAVAVA